MESKTGSSMFIEKSFLWDLKHKNEIYSKEYKENNDEDENNNDHIGNDVYQTMNAEITNTWKVFRI